MMKKLLSILLAVAMMVSMVPAAYAEDEITVVEAPAEADDIVIGEEPQPAEEPEIAPAEEPAKEPEPAAEPMGNSHEDVTPLTPDVETTAEITEEGGYAYFSFTPETTDDYEFVSFADWDTYGYIYDADWNELTHDDDSGEGNNFCVRYELQAGETYYFGARYYSSSSTGSFTVKLSTYFNNHFFAMAVHDSISVLPGENATLEVAASSKHPQMITYEWFDSNWDPLEDAENAPIYETGPMTFHRGYYCRVSDGYGWTYNLWFYVRIETHFSAKASQEEIYVPLNETATLRVSVTSDTPETVTYSWRDADGNAIDGATGDSFTTGPITGNTMYICDVEDGYGLGESVYFYVYVDTHFHAEAVQSNVRAPLGESATLEVNATSDLQDAITYRWFDTNWNEIEGAMDSSLTVTPEPNYTRFWCTVSDGYSSADVFFVVNVETHFSAEAVQSEFRVASDESATLELKVEAGSDLPLSYQWEELFYSGGGVWATKTYIEGATDSSLTVQPVAGVSEVRYACTVSDGYHGDYIVFSIIIDTHFSAEAVQREFTIAPDECVTLEVNATSDLQDAITYKWYDDTWNEIEGATGSSVTVKMSDGRSYMYYYCEVSDGYYSTNVEFYVRVETHFQSGADQRSFRVPYGETATLTVWASSDLPLSYQWQEQREVADNYGTYWVYDDIDGATESSFTTPEVTQAQEYYCYVTDGYNSSREWFSVSVDTHFNAYTNQYDHYVPLGGTATLQVTASSDLPLSYQWQEYKEVEHDDGYDTWTNWEWVDLEGETGESLVTAPVTGYRQYRCQVSDEYNSSSVWFNVYVDTNFKAEAVQQNFRVAVGETVTLEVIATSDEPEKISYRWLQGRTESGNVFRWVTIAGETGSSFTTPPAEKSTQYRCEVSDGYGQIKSIDFRVNLDYTNQIPALAQPLLLDTDMTARISGDCEYAFYYFIPEESGEYIISSYGEDDTFVHFYNADCRQLDTDDDSGEHNNFYLACDLNAGETYYYGVRFLDRNQVGVIAFRFWRGNELRVMPEYQEVNVPLGETATLTVNATAIDMSGISYQWQEDIEIQGETYSYWEWVDLEGETGTSFTTPAVTGHKSYRCVVQDGLGGSAAAIFEVNIDTHFEVYAEQTEFAVIPGETVSMHVIASSDDPDKITYQWYRGSKYYDDNGSWWWSWGDDTMIEGANGDTWVSDPVEEAAAYFCRVEDGYGANKTMRFTVGIDTHFTVRQQQERIKVPAGETATLEVIASSDEPDKITYQWYCCTKYYYSESEWGWSWSNDDILVGKTGSSLTTGPINEEQAYVCQVQDGYGSQRVLWFYISVETHFTAKAEQTDIYAKLNEPATLRVIASSDYPEKISYAWYCRGRLMENETGATLVTDPVTEAKWYDCRVSDGYGSTITVHFMVHVDTNFSAKAKQNKFYIQPGESVDLEMIVQSNYPEKISVEWYKCSKVYYSDYDWSWSRELIEGAEGPTLTTGPINEWAHYEVTVWNGFGEGWGEEFDVYIDTDFKAEAVNEKVYVPYEQSTELEVAASVKAPGELSYQWYSTKIMTYMDETYWEEMTPIDGETGPTLTTGPVKEHELYLCRVEDGFGREAIIEFNVYVNTGFTAEAEEEHVYVSMGDTATLRVIAGADDGVELGYSWFRYYTVSDGIYEGEYHEWIENIGPALTVRNVGGYSHYACLVSDDFGNEKLVHFYVHIQNHFAAEAVNPVNVIGANETVELKLNVSGDDLEGLTYQWYNYRMDGMALAYYDYFEISGETGSTFVATTKYEKYRCVVKDRFGTPIAVDFTVKESGDGFTVTVDDHYVTSRGNVLAHTDLDTSLLYSGEVEFTVSSDGNKAVLVLVETGDGYTVLPCTTDADGVHHYTVNVTGDTKLVLTFRGDADLNAAVNMRDSLAIKKHSAGTAPLTGVALLAANADSNAAVNMRDGLSVKKQSAGTAMIAW